MYGYIYKITNILDNTVYIGKRELDHFDEKYWGSGKHLKNAISKYGLINFTRTIIDTANDKNELCLKEIFWISFARCHYDRCYNIAEGGQGGTVKNKKQLYPEWCEKTSISCKKKFEDESYRNWRIENSKQVYENKTSINKDGIVKEIDNSVLDRYLLEGWVIGRGKRNASVGKNISAGKSNTICINKDGKNKYVKANLLDTYINDGWNLGRDDSNIEYNHKGKIHIHKESEIKIILESELPTYLAQGWELGEPHNTNKGQGTKGKKYMNNGVTNIFVIESEIQSYLDKGYKLGMIRKNKN